MSDDFAMYDAAYLLGALTPPDRAAFEAHLQECSDCRRSVNSLAGMPGLLASVSPEGLEEAAAGEPPLPDTLLPNLLAEVQRSRFRRRFMTGLVGVAAAAVVTIALVVGLAGGSSPGPQQAGPHVAAVQMTPVIAKLPIHAKVTVAAKEWGSQLRIWCTYDGFSSGPYAHQAFTYTMVVTDKSGATQQIAAWTAQPGEPVVLDASTSVPKAQIASVQVRGPSDVPVLELQL